MTLSPLTHDTPHRFPIAVVRLRGELPAGPAHVLRAALLDALTEEPTALVVNLSEVTAVDHAAAGALVAAERELAVLTEVAAAAERWPQARVLLCAPSPPVAEALANAGVTPHLPVYDTVADALAVATADPVPQRIYRHLEPTVEAPRTGRALAAYACWQWGLPEPATAAQIVASELVANAVRHAHTPVGFAVSLRDGSLRVSVRDGASRPARIQAPGELDEHGRGLLIVDSVAEGWGSMPLGSGKVVWAAVPARARAVAGRSASQS